MIRESYFYFLNIYHNFCFLFCNFIMSKRTEGNIGESNKTSVKVHYGPGGQSNWSLGWAEE